MKNFNISVVLYLRVFLIIVSTLAQERRGPVFTYDPPSRVDFSNTTGTVIPCSAEGIPSPSIRWTLADGSPVLDISGLRHVRPDGSLVFPPFRADEYRPDIHSVMYRCIASNAIGSIGSRDVHVKGVVNQHYVVDLYDEYVTTGNTAALRCNIPSFMEEHVTLTSWKEEPTGTVIQPSGTLGGRYLTFPWGTLYIRNIDMNFSYRSYKCQTRNRLTGEIVESSTSGRLIVTEARSSLRPRITDARPHITGSQGEVVSLPCAAQGFPVPTYHWFLQENGQLRGLPGGHRVTQLEGTLVIHQATVADSGHYVCVVNNSAGDERTHTHLLITAPLSAMLVPPTQKIHVGRSCTVNCSVSGHPIHTVIWRKNVGPLHLDSRVVQLSRDVLHIDPVQREDRGMYQCFVYNDKESAQAAVELSLGDDAPEFQETFQEQTVQPGPSLSLKCVASGNPLPQIIWKLDDSAIPENHRIRFGDYVTKDGAVVSFVNITNLKTEDGGDYQCVANNGVGEVSYVARVNVMGPPMVRRMRNITVVAGEVLVLRCPVAGYPLENIYWERAGVRLPYNHRQKAHDNGTLEVHHVERATDQGPYVCVATNKAGQTAQSTVNVKVQVKPVIEPFTFPKLLREGQRASVLCTVSSGDLPIKTSWFKDGQAIPENIGIRSNEVADYSSTLLFESLSLRHKGNYTCIAGNDAGTVSHTATMVIHVPPRWVIEPSEVFVIKGKGLTVDCQTEGFPQPRVRWTKSEGDSPRDFKSIVSSPHLQVFENGSLSIQDASEEDAGYYLCQASNGIGQGLSKVIRLKVHIAAHFKSKFTAEMVRKGHNTRLKCEAIGDRPIAISWMKDKVNIKPQADPRYELVEAILPTGVVSDILIRQADRRDSALFSCIASNAFGKDDTNIQLIVQEPSDPIHDLKVTETTSRTVKLGWIAPSNNGNSPITHYLIQFKDEGGKWHNRMPNVSVSGAESSGVVSGLKPSKIYFFRIVVENRIGRSEPSKPIEAMTEEEAPGGGPVKIRAHPTSSKSMKVTWKPPTIDLQHGILKGYYVGYKVVGSSDSYVYKTLEIGEGFKEECHVTGLRRFTKYSLVVQAFNSKGAGPPSDEVVVQTLENDPPTTPPLSVMDKTTSSIQLSWDLNYDTSNPVTGYVLHKKSDTGAWEEMHIPGEQGTHTIENLQCGTRYQFFLTAYNSAGKGEPSDILPAKTDGGAPLAPDKHSMISTNMTAATMNFYSWHDGGCPITSFIVKYRQQQDTDWTVLNDGPLPDNRRTDMVGLSPGSWYQIQISASNIAGTTDAEYTFSTLTSADIITPKSVVNKVPAPFYLDLTIILPIAVSVIVIVIVLAVVCFVIRKKHSSDSSHYGTGPYDGRKGGGQDTMRMTEMEKNKNHHGSTSGSYYPTPYATTHISSGRRTDDGTDSGYHQEEPLYATVKRTPRPPRSDGHIYHCPGLLLEADHNQMSNTSGSSKDSGMIVKLSESDTERRSSGYSRKGRDSKYLRNS